MDTIINVTLLSIDTYNMDIWMVLSHPPLLSFGHIPITDENNGNKRYAHT